MESISDRSDLKLFHFKMFESAENETPVHVY